MLRRAKLGCLTRVLAAATLVLSSATAEGRTPAGGTLAERYENALKTLETQQANESETRVERDRLAAEALSLQQRLIENAAKVQSLEAAYAATEAELIELNAGKSALEDDLRRDRDRITHLLAVLQRLYTGQPPALALRPEDPLAAARGTMLVGTMLPPVYEQATQLSRRLRQLAEASEAVIRSAERAKSEAEALRNARAELDRLLAVRSRETAQADVKLTELHGVTEEIARQTNGLKSLIDRISMLRASSGRRTPGMTVVLPRNEQAGLRRGSLRVPVVGTMMVGDPAGPGRTPGSNTPSGLWFVGEGGSAAVAPGDSEVVFSGPYQKFGQVLILEIGGGYHLTLAGLGRIDVRIGDRVLAGEPVGSLPEGSAARLYLELRRNGQTVDPAPWMSAELRKANGT